MQKVDNAVTGYAQQILNQVRKVVVGKDNVLLWVLAAILSKGHILLEDIPGVGKTTMALAFSRVLNLDYNRVQFTPDVLPSDVTGYSIPDQRTGEMVYQKGAVLCNLFLADELNRATSRTQSALLEAMEEGQVTVDGTTRAIAQPFMVMATQNPIESYGTFPLPEAQLDRFLFKVIVPFPTLQELSGIVDMTVKEQTRHAQPVAKGEEILNLRSIARQVPIAPSVQEAALKLVLATHPEQHDAPEATQKYLRFGASPRAAQAMLSTARVRALEQGRYNVSFDDLRFVAPACLRHRLAVNFEAMTSGVQLEDLIDDLVHEYLHG